MKKSFLIALLVLVSCSANAQLSYEQGLKYLQASGAAQDVPKGIGLVRQASDLGYAPAQLVLGYAYLKGQGVTQDVAKGIALFEKAGAQGLVDAQYNAGLAYLRGQGVKADLKKAAEWFAKAAEQGDAGAQYNLGVMYYGGEGVPKDPVLALVWFTFAAENKAQDADRERDIAAKELNADQAHAATREIARLRDKIARNVAKQGQLKQAAAAQ